MRTALTLAMSAVFALVTGVAWAADDVEETEVVAGVVEDLDSLTHIEKADYYYQRYADTLEEARQAAEKGDWDLYNEIYQKAQYYRREYEFYRKGAAGAAVPSPTPTVVYRTYTPPPVRYEVHTYAYPSPRVYYYTPAPIYYYHYTPGPSVGFRLRVGDYPHYRPHRYTIRDRHDDGPRFRRDHRSSRRHHDHRSSRRGGRDSRGRRR